MQILTPIQPNILEFNLKAMPMVMAFLKPIMVGYPSALIQILVKLPAPDLATNNVQLKMLHNQVNLLLLVL